MPDKIAVIGSSFIDCKSYLKDVYDPQGKNYGKTEFVHGGIGRNIAENMADLDCEVSFISTIDNSSFGLDMAEKLKNKGVETEHLLPVKEGAMGIWTAMINHEGLLQCSVTQLPDFGHLEKYLEKYAEKFAKFYPAVLLELDMSEKITSKVISAFKKHKRNIFVYGSNPDKAVSDHNLYSHISCIVVNEDVAAKMLGQDIRQMEVHIIQKALKEFIQQHEIERGIITLNKRGSVFYDNLSNQSGYIEPIETEVIDTSGAGEALFAATTAAVLQGLSLKDAVTIGADYAGAAIAQTSNNPVDREKISKIKEDLKKTTN